MWSHRRSSHWSHRERAVRTCRPSMKSLRTVTWRSAGVKIGDVIDCRQHVHSDDVVDYDQDWKSRRRDFHRRILGKLLRDHGTRMGNRQRWIHSRMDHACVFDGVNFDDDRSLHHCVLEVLLCRTDHRYDAFSLRRRKSRRKKWEMKHKKSEHNQKLFSEATQSHSTGSHLM